MYSIFEERAMRLRRGQKATAENYLWRDAFISEVGLTCLLAEYPGLFVQPKRNRTRKRAANVGMCNYKQSLASRAANVGLSESEVNKIYEAQHPDQIP